MLCFGYPETPIPILVVPLFLSIRCPGTIPPAVCNPLIVVVVVVSKKQKKKFSMQMQQPVSMQFMQRKTQMCSSSHSLAPGAYACFSWYCGACQEK